MNLPNNTIARTCKVFGYLNSLEDINFISSKELALAIGTTGHTVRKDISILGITGYTRKGYDVKALKNELGSKLNLNKKRKACIVGLGRLGTALLDYEKFQKDGFEIVAGFDNSINKLERIKTDIKVSADIYMKDIIKENSIELGIITTPSKVAQEVADKLIDAGVKGILNFSPIKIIVPEHIIYQDMDFTNSLRFIAAQLKTEA